MSTGSESEAATVEQAVDKRRKCDKTSNEVRDRALEIGSLVIDPSLHEGLRTERDADMGPLPLNRGKLRPEIGGEVAALNGKPFEFPHFQRVDIVQEAVSFPALLARPHREKDAGGLSHRVAGFVRPSNGVSTESLIIRSLPIKGVI